MENNTPEFFNINTSETQAPSSAQAPKPKSGKKMFIGILSLLITITGVAAGVALVQTQQIFKSQASGTWSITNQNLNFCSGSNCTIPGDWVAGDGSVVNCSAGVSGYMFYCPNQDVGSCFSNEQSIGSFSSGQSVNVVSIASQKDCGTVQIDFNAPGASSSSGNCGGVILKNSTCDSGSVQPGDSGSAPTPTPKPICGEPCSKDSDCASATGAGITVVCREGQCVNQECYDTGGQTTPGTICSCENKNLCGDLCGVDVGLCEPGYSCTYPAQSQCIPGKTTYCIPSDLSSIPTHEGSPFERLKCGPTTQDKNNNYISNSSLPNHLFTQAEIVQYLCNSTATPTSPPTETFDCQCLELKAYNLEWKELNAETLSTLKPDDTIYLAATGIATDLEITKARFSINNSEWIETATHNIKAKGTKQFYISYTIPEIPEGQSTFTLNVKAQLYHPTFDWF